MGWSEFFCYYSFGNMNFQDIGCFFFLLVFLEWSFMGLVFFFPDYVEFIFLGKEN